MNRLLHAAALWAALSVAQSAAAAQAKLPQRSPDRSLGVGSCTNSLCHGSARHWLDSNVLQNEYLTWSRKDKHARAYAVLLNERSKEIARKLGLPQPAHESSLCLDCHAHNVPAAQRGSKFVLSDGVTCESCHGPAQRWIRGHVEAQATHAGNLADGMYPLSDDVQRARLCMSCHLGNSDKFVNHRMLAAGHPRLSFELDTFTQIAPMHFQLDADWIRRKGAWDSGRAWAVGQALSAVQLLEALADPKRGRAGLFPELALFDCHACHHPMSDKRGIGVRRDLGPGLVRLNESSLLMLSRIAARVDGAAAARFDRHIELLRRAIAGGEDTVEHARTALRESDQLLARIVAHQRFTADDLRTMLDGLLAQGLAGRYEDYLGAEQATMAVQSMTDLLVRGGVLQPNAIKPALDNLMASVSDDEKFRPHAFQNALRDLRAVVQASR